MPIPNPGKKAFAAIIGIAAAIGALTYVLFGLAAPEPGINTPAYQGGPPPAITTSEEMEAKQNNTATNQTQTAQE